MLSIIIPVYKTAGFIPLLVPALEDVAAKAMSEFGFATEVVFVDDGSPDDSHLRLSAALPHAKFKSQLIRHSRNFGSFAAIRTGLASAQGSHFAIIAADLQEPPDIIINFLRAMLTEDADIAVGLRMTRDDPAMSAASANLFWALYRRLVIHEIPPGGVDVFGCNRQVRDHLLAFPEAGSSLVAQLYWVGFHRVQVPYQRRPRMLGRSAWTFGKKITYLLDSIFAFTDLPIRILLILGVLGVFTSVILGLGIFVLRLANVITVPGYAPTMLIVLFFGMLNILGIGIVGSYVARAYENTKQRPLAVVKSVDHIAGAGRPD